MTDDISRALADGETMETGMARTLLRAAVSRVMFCPYCQTVLDVTRAVLLDGTDYTTPAGAKGGASVLDAACYDLALEKTGGLEKLQEGLGYQVDVYDGRVLFASHGRGRGPQ
jgi:hypothetical protein